MKEHHLCYRKSNVQASFVFFATTLKECERQMNEVTVWQGLLEPRPKPTHYVVTEKFEHINNIYR